MTDLDTLYLETGLEEIPFGSSMDHVIATLGTPDSRETDDEGDTTFEYEELALTFFFWKDDFEALGSIGTERPGTKVLGHALMGENRDVIVDFINKKFSGGISEEDSCVHEDGHVQSWIEVGSMGITFWFDDGFLYLIDWTGEVVQESEPSDKQNALPASAPTAVPAVESAATPETTTESPAQPSADDIIPLPEDLMECWESCYPDAPPIGFLLKHEYPTLWLRIHSLPDGKRWPTEESEWETLFERHYRCAAEVLQEGAECAVLLLASSQTPVSEINEAAALGGTFVDMSPLDEDLWDRKRGVFDEPMSLFGLGIRWRTGAHKAFLRAVAEDKVKALVVELEEGCVYAPYGGGADLFYDTEEDRDAARKRHAAWLPPRKPRG